MFRKLALAVTFAATFSVAGFVLNDSAEARRRYVGRRPTIGTYYYYNGPTVAFSGPPIRYHSSAWDIGPYGPGYGWPYPYPVGRMWVDF
jgi:hypothetical protein